MASIVKGKTLRVTIQEELVLNGIDYGSKTKLNISEITEICKRIVPVVSGADTGLIGFDTTSVTDDNSFYPIVGAFDEDTVMYIRITNLDDTNYIQLAFKNEDNDESIHKLDAGQSFIFNGDLSGGVKDCVDGVANASIVLNSATLGDLESIRAAANTATCDVEVFVASK